MDGTYWSQLISKVVVESGDLEVHLVLRQINLNFYDTLSLPPFHFPFDPELIKEGAKTGDADLCKWLGEPTRYTGLDQVFGDYYELASIYAIWILTTGALLEKEDVSLIEELKLTTIVQKHLIPNVPTPLFPWLKEKFTLRSEDMMQLLLPTVLERNEERLHALEVSFPNLYQHALTETGQCCYLDFIYTENVFDENRLEDLTYLVSKIPNSCRLLRCFTLHFPNFSSMAAHMKCRKRDMRRLFRFILKQTCRRDEFYRRGHLCDHLCTFRDYNFILSCTCCVKENDLVQ